MKFSYKLWGADVVSDIFLDLNDSNLKKELVELKMLIDRNNDITFLFLIEDGKVTATGNKSSYYAPLGGGGQAELLFSKIGS